MKRKIEKAVILAAGKGTRMGELTAELPKPMLSVKGLPVLERIVRSLAAASVRNFLIVTGYKAEVVESHFGDGSDFGCSIEFVRQVTQDGTGKVVELAKVFAGADPFLLVYGDILVEPETYMELLNTFEKRDGAEGVVTVNLGEDVSKGGLLLFDEEFRLIDLAEKPGPERVKELQSKPNFKPWYNAGLYAFSPAIFPRLASHKKSVRGEYELTDAIRALAVETRAVFGMKIQGYWIDVRDPDLLAKAQEVIAG